MPSIHQAGSTTGDYDSEAVKMLATKNDATIKAIVRGIRRPERCVEYIEAELALADAEGRDPRQKLIALLNDQQADVTDDEDDGDE